MLPRSLTNIARPSFAAQRRPLFRDAQQHVVENSGSIARDVLAAERTFLAWSRTGLGFVGAGSALFAAYHQQHHPDSTDHWQSQQQQYCIYPASALLVGNGAFLLTFATRRYLRTIHYLMQDQFSIDTRGTLLAIVVTATSTLTSLGLVLYGEYRKQTGHDSGSGKDSDKKENQREQKK